MTHTLTLPSHLPLHTEEEDGVVSYFTHAWGLLLKADSPTLLAALVLESEPWELAA